MNIDIDSGVIPSPQQAKDLGFVRWVFRWRRYAGEVFDDAINRHKAAIAYYRVTGVKIILVLTQEMGLDGQGYDYRNLDHNRYDPEYTALARSIAERLQPDIVQIHNEQDSEDPEGRASIVMQPVAYGRLFNMAYPEIKAVAPNTKVFTGGYVSGGSRAVQQFRAAGITRCDGIAIHLYGVSANGTYGVNGALASHLNAVKALRLPILISEFGTLGIPNEPVNKIAAFAAAFMTYVKAAGVVFASWFDWRGGDAGAFQGYAVVNPDGSVRQPLYDALKWAGSSTTPTPTPEPSETRRIQGIPTLNLRASASINSAVIGRVNPGDAVAVLSSAWIEDRYKWVNVWSNGKTGWIAARYVDANGNIAWDAYFEDCTKEYL